MECVTIDGYWKWEIYLDERSEHYDLEYDLLGLEELNNPKIKNNICTFTTAKYTDVKDLGTHIMRMLAMNEYISYEIAASLYIISDDSYNVIMRDGELI